MTTLEQLKDTAQKIIKFASDKDNGSKTWDEQLSAPDGGFTDRAGFVVMSDVEAYADVGLMDKDNAVIRARIAKVIGEGSDERFLIVTLDFFANVDSVKNAVANRTNVSGETLISILNQEETAPKLIHISYNTGRSSKDLVGKRYEYSGDQIKSLPRNEADEFAQTLRLTFESIMKDTSPL